MNVKIPPYPNFTITKKSLKGSDNPTVKKSNSDGLSRKLLMLVPFSETEHKVFRTRSIEHNGNLYISPLPNPVHLFLTSGIEHFQLSENIKIEKWTKCRKQIGEDIFWLPNEENDTHQCYNDYIKYRSSSIIMLVSSLEAFINHVIPNDFTYQTRKGQYSKIEIESMRVTFHDKLNKVIPQFLGQNEFWEENPMIKKSILELYNVRKNIIHLKTKAEDDFTAYFQTIDDMLDLNIGDCINNVVTFMNLVSPNFVELED